MNSLFSNSLSCSKSRFVSLLLLPHKMAHSEPHFPVLMPHVVPQPSLNHSWPLWPRKCHGSDSMLSPRLSRRRHGGFPLDFSGITCSRGSQLPCCEDVQAALWQGPQGRELRASTSSQHQLANHKRGAPWKLLLQPQKSLQMTEAQADTEMQSPGRCWTRTNLPSHWFPDLQKL